MALLPGLGRFAWHLILTSRPISWINTAFPFGAAVLLSGGRVDAWWILGVIYFLIPYNLAVYGVNDVFDYESDIRNPRKGGAQGDILPQALHAGVLWAVVITNAPILAAMMVLRWDWSSLLLVACVVMALAYSVPVLRFKERAGLDSATSSFHFVGPALYGVAAGGHWSGDVVLSLIAFYLWGLAAHAFGAVQDIAADREAGLGSIATVIGAKATTRFSMLLWAVSGIAMLFTAWPAPLAALVVVPYIEAVWPYRNLDDSDCERAQRGWRWFMLLNYVCGFFLTMLILVTKVL